MPRSPKLLYLLILSIAFVIPTSFWLGGTSAAGDKGTGPKASSALNPTNSVVPRSASLQSAAGQLDPSFGSGGTLTTDFGGFETTSDIALAPDGTSYYVAGRSSSSGAPNGKIFLARYNSDGSLSASFGSSGKVTQAIGSLGWVNRVGEIAVQADGKIVVAGTYILDNNQRFLVTRFLEDGSLDTSFNSTGYIIDDFGANAFGQDLLETANAVAIQTDGSIVVGGAAARPNSSSHVDFALARYTTSGQSDTSFGAGGHVITSLGLSNSNIIRDMVIQPDDKIVVAGGTGVMARYHVNGALDSNQDSDPDVSFRSTGIVNDYGLGVISALALQPDGKFVVVSSSTKHFRDNTISRNYSGVRRVNSDGSRDNSFGALRGGFQFPGESQSTITDINDLAIYPNGKIVFAGSSSHVDELGFPIFDGFALAVHNFFGGPDTSFGNGGQVITPIEGSDFPFEGFAAAVVQGYDRVVAAGRTTGSDALVAAYHAPHEKFALNLFDTALNASETTSTHQVVVTLEGPTAQTVTVDYATGDDTATAGTDYQAVSGTLTFAPGETRKTFNLAIIGDTIAEPSETMLLTLSNPVNAVLGAPNRFTVIIHDNPQVSFTKPAPVVLEKSGAATISVAVNFGGLPITVDYAVTAGTATAGSDFTPVSGTLSFTGGQRVKTFDVPIAADSLDESNETIILTLSNPTNAGLDAPNPTTLTIINGPDCVECPTVNVSERDGFATVEVHRALTTESISVNYTTWDGKAEGGEDYTSVSGTLEFAVNEGTKNIIVPILRDERYDPDETFFVTLESSGLTLSDSLIIVRILDASIVVNSTNSSNPGPDDCTLVRAIEAANSDAIVGGCQAGSGADSIFVPAGTYPLTLADNTSGGWGSNALPVITTQINIIGAGAGATVIERAADAPDMRLFYIWHQVPASLTLDGLTLRGGRGGEGAAIRSSLFLTIKNCVISHNESVGNVRAGAVYQDQTPLTITDSTFVNNVSASGGGAVAANAGLTLSGSTFVNNKARAGEGGAVMVGGSPATITNSRFLNNYANAGGAIKALTTLTVSDSLISGNTAFENTGGGGIHHTGRTLTLIRTTVSNNKAVRAGGGGISGCGNNSPLFVTDSTISGNHAVGDGGGICGNQMTLVNTTISGNSTTGNGGGISIQGGTFEFNSVTITDNTADSDRNSDSLGGGVRANAVPGSLRNTIIAGNHDWVGYPDIYTGSTPATSRGHNLVGNIEGFAIAAVTGDQFGAPANPINALLGPLQNNGGLTATHALLPGSPALDAADPAAPGSGGNSAPATDQRGRPRASAGNTRADIGAYEVATTTAADLSLVKTVTPLVAYIGRPVTYTLHATNSGSVPLDSVSIIDQLPSGLSYASSSVTQGSCSQNGGRVTCDLGTLAPDTTVVITVVTSATAQGVHVNTAKATTNTPESDLLNNAAVAVSTVKLPITVNTITQESGFATDCTLSQAIEAANSDEPVGGCIAGNGADIIILPAGTYTLNFAPYSAFGAPIGLPLIESEISIEGAGAATTLISRGAAAPDFRILYLYHIPQGTLTLSNLTISNGRAPSGPGGAIANANGSGPLAINDCVLSNNTTVNGGGGAINMVGAPLTISNSTFMNNSTAGSFPGGAISMSGQLASSDTPVLTVTGSTFTSNSAGGNGGAISGNVIEITGSSFSGNSASSGGAVSGVFLNLVNALVTGNQATLSSDSSGGGGGLSYLTVFLTRSTVSGNQSAGGGGGLKGTSTTIIDSTVSGNTAVTDGGGIGGGNHVTVNNSTISGNSARASGGGIRLQGSLFLNNATITNNTADSTNNGAGHAGGGIRADGSSGSIRNSIIAGNHEFRGSVDFYTGATSLISQGHNLIGDNSGCNIAPATGDLFGTQSSPVNPLLGPLQNNGGPTQTHALLTNSPAIDTANSATPDGTGNSCLPNDQRGANRPEDGNGDSTVRCDIGAFELAAPASPSVDVAVSISDAPDPATVGSPLTYTITIANAGPSTATGVNVTDTLAAGLSFVSATSSQGTFMHPGNTLIFNLGSLAKDATATITIIVTPTAPGSFDNTATVTAIEGDANGGDNSATANTTASQSEVLSITRVTPNRGGNVGPVITRVIGAGIDQGATMKLVRAGYADIPGGSASAAANGLSIGTIFDLSGQAAGAWDVWVVNPDGQTATLEGAFTIEVGHQPNIWSDIVGPAGVRPGREATYNIVYGNEGNVDAFGVFLEVSFAKGVTYRLNFDTQEPTQVPGKEIDLSLIPNHIEVGERTIIPLYIPYVRSAGTHTLRFVLTVPPNVALPDDQVKLQVRHTDPILAYVPPGGSSASAESLKGPRIRLTPNDGGGCGSIDLGFSPDAQDCVLNFLGSLVECLGLLAPPGTPPNCILALVSYLGGLAGDVCQFLNSPNTPKIVIASKLLSSAVNFLLDCFGVSGGWFDADKVIACLASIYNVFDSCAKFFHPARRALVHLIFSYDPNDKVGAAGVGAGRFVQQHPVPYTIFFENLATASGSAQVVTITDQLDPAKLALATFSFGPVTFGDQSIDPPPGVTDFVTDVDLRPRHDLILRVEGHLTMGTGLVTWTFSSLDPATGQITNDPFEGFLPPNISAPEGEGSVSFFVQPADGLATDTQITNGASIVFDTNAPINTPSWLNTIDNDAPVSQVSPLAAQQLGTSFMVQWIGSDAGSGVAAFTVYVSENGGPYDVWLTTTQTSANFFGQGNKTYSFYSVAEDAVGNVEAVPATPDTVTTIPGGPTAAPASISGRITTTEGVPLAGVTITLSGGQEGFTVTDNQGNYSFANVRTENFYVLTPSRVNFTFTPASRSFSLIGNTSDATFNAIPSAGQQGNPLDTTEYFVRQHYLDFLGREPDAAGLVFWSNQIHECGADAECLERRRINVSAAYFLSIEFQGTGGIVDGVYRASYGRRPLYVEFMPDVAAMAEGVEVGKRGWEQKLTANKRAFIESYVNRAAFRAAFDHQSNETYVDTLISHTRNSLSQDEREALVASLHSGTATRADVLLRVVENAEFVRARRNEAFVMMQYFGYLRRDPDESGYQFWLAKLNQFNGNFEQAEMVKAFITSGEYRDRFR